MTQHERCLAATDARDALQLHDRYYMMSDDHRVYQRGEIEALHICTLLDQMERHEVATLADTYLDNEPLNGYIACRLYEARGATLAGAA